MITQLSAELRLKLLRVARQSLEKFMENEYHIQFPTEIPELLEKTGGICYLKKKE